MELGLSFYLAAGASLLLIGLSKGGVGGMLGPLVTATMALAVPADIAIGLLLPLLIAGDAFAVAAHWRRWSRIHVLRLVPASAIGVVLAVAVITHIRPEHLRRGLAVLILIFIVYRVSAGWIHPVVQYQSRWWYGPLAGAVAGLTSGLAHVGGPPISIYLLLQDLPPEVYAATSALFFAALNLIKLPFYGASGLIRLPILVRTFWLLPLLPIGVWLGKKFALWVAKETFERIILALLVVSAILLLIEP